MKEKKTIVFDWGDTLMKTFPNATGPMVFWPEVSQVDGMGEALHALHGQYPMIVATNASESSAEQVRLALGRVGLDGYIQQVFTYQELGFRKPESGFFRKIETILGTQPEEMVMVGDSYANDILGARNSGWQAIWFNQDRQFSPGLAAMHNVEIDEMRALPEAVNRLGIPDWETCRSWYAETSPSMRLWLHVQLVASTAYVLAIWIRRNGGKVDPIMAQRGGLLHDICKLQPGGADEKKMDHGQLGAEWLAARGQSALAEIARRHVLNAILEESRRPQTMEEKVVFFADKLCEDARLVDLDTRIIALKGRYQNHAASIDSCVPALKGMEKELADAAGVPAERMVEMIRQVINRTN